MCVFFVFSKSVVFLVVVGHDALALVFQVSLFLFNLDQFGCLLVGLEPSVGFLECLVNDGPFFRRETLALAGIQVLQHILHRVHVVLQPLNSVDSLFGEGVGFFVLFGLLDHLLDLFFGESASEVVDDYLLADAGA